MRDVAELLRKRIDDLRLEASRIPETELVDGHVEGLVKDDYVAGDLGFDPLGLGSKRSDMALSEIKHGRIAMLAVTGHVVAASGARFGGELAKRFVRQCKFAANLCRATFQNPVVRDTISSVSPELIAQVEHWLTRTREKPLHLHHRLPACLLFL